ncbi:hypothetical protein C8R46DRAFT_1106819 [Mycena filopes]|nr:hypothetical protein C8R46DRAFT_1106819 [Mycena filopes]
MSSWRNPNPARGTSKWRGAQTKPQPAVAEPKRKMELLASVSRSSGLEKDGDALKDFGVQAEYREFIQEKLDGLWQKHPQTRAESETETRQRIDAQENILILFRKLREGIISSKRTGPFTLEVYETSLHLAVLFDSPRHIGPVIPALMSYFTPPSTKTDNPCAQTILICLLHQLVAAYPSQHEFHSSMASIPNALFPADSEARLWITSVARCIRGRNYAKISNLTQLSALPLDDDDALPKRATDLSRRALYHLVELLRSKTREMAWTVMRSAYRELSCQKEEPKLDTREWLERSLGLTVSEMPGKSSPDLDEWLERESVLGHVRRKEGVEGRWIVCTPR